MLLAQGLCRESEGRGKHYDGEESRSGRRKQGLNRSHNGWRWHSLVSTAFVNTQMLSHSHCFIDDDTISNATMGVKNFNRLEQ